MSYDYDYDYDDDCFDCYDDDTSTLDTILSVWLIYSLIQYFSDNTIYNGIGTDNADTIYGDNLDNIMYGFGGNDTIYGEAGNDLIYAGSGNDTIYGGAGNDIIYTGSGKDTVYGGYGHDIIYGGLDQNTIYGESGNDIIYAGIGYYDYLSGGQGFDRFVIQNDQTLEYRNHEIIIADFTPGQDKIDLSSFNYHSFYDVELINNNGWFSSETKINIDYDNAHYDIALKGVNISTLSSDDFTFAEYI